MEAPKGRSGSFSDAMRILVRTAIGLIVPTALILLWETLSAAGVIDELFFPRPSRIAERAQEMILSGQLSEELGLTLLRIALGFAVGGFGGFVVGIAMARLRALRDLLEPMMSAVYTVPKIALLPIFFGIFGLGDAPVIALVTFTVFFYVWVYTLETVSKLPSQYVETARAIGASEWEVLRLVILPSSAPGVLAGLRVGVAVATLITIASEFIAGSDGVGYLIFNSRALLRMEEAYVGIVSVAIMGFVLQWIVKSAGVRLIPWLDSGNLDSGVVRG